MAAYKVIQDVEAEDKLFGPLTIRQFAYMGIAAVSLYLTYFVSTKGAGFLAAVFIPVAMIAAFFGFPWGRDQPTELWALAKIRFMIKPRRRIWNQSGVKELVTITAPKQAQTNYTNGLSQTEVHSRLRALADTIDSRGWAIKNANLNLYSRTPLVLADPGSDRLVAPSALPQPVDSSDVQAADDMLDEKNNARAQHLDSMITQSAKSHRDRLMQHMQSDTAQASAPAAPANNYWFLNQPAAPQVPANMMTFNTQVVTPGMPAIDASGGTAPQPTVDEATLVAQLEASKHQGGYEHLHRLQPLAAQPPGQPAVPLPAGPAPLAPPTATPTGPQATPQTAPLTPPNTPVAAPVTPAAQAAILTLANNDDLDVATIAREAERNSALQNEVVIKLH